ncbi:MAG: hypothetical protein K2X81_28760 [Candidatus Obscuribacterales bacterium]|nr:hypothetical protein [Candidatus Obscuribacterales bacterium]
MANNALDQVGTQAKPSDSCNSALAALAKDSTNQELVKSVLQACNNNARVPDAFPSAKDLIQNQSAPEKSVDKAHVQALVNTLDKAINSRFWGSATPDGKTIERTLNSASKAERDEIQKTYLDQKHKAILESLGNVYGTASSDYHKFKGLLLKDDSKASADAVAIHTKLMEIDKQSFEIAKNNKGVDTGFFNNAIDNDEFSAGTGGAIDALGVLAGSAARNSLNKELSNMINKLDANEINELKQEHLRIYRRDLADMAENTHGISDQAKKAFGKAGIQ